MRDLVKKYLEGNCTPEEKTLIETWYAQLNMQDRTPLSERDLAKAGRLMQNEIFADTEKYYKLRRFYSIAAACILGLLLAAGGIMHCIIRNAGVNYVATDVAPGSSKALLTLSNGKTVVLDSIQIGQIAAQQSSRIVKLDSGQIAYRSSSGIASPGSTAGLPAYNTLSVPKGGEFKLVLPDGTKVWMNSASVLKYPVSFAGQKTREIYLSGEAYFEVAHDKQHPFLVKSDKQVAKVLGTHFDINAYPDNASVSTTLLEGSLEVNSLLSKDSCRLVPGKQAVLDKKIKVQDADVENVMDWKDGYFIFHREPLNDILMRLARWYNIEVVYKSKVQAVKFDGIISKHTPLSEVLAMLSGTGKAHFDIRNRVVYASE